MTRELLYRHPIFSFCSRPRIALAALSLTVLSMTSSATSAEEYTYFSDGQEITLHRSHEWVAARTAPATALPAQLPTSLSPETRRELINHGIVLLRTAEPRNSETAADAVRELAGLAEVDLAMPVFDADNALMIATDTFVARFEPGFDPAQIEALNARFSVQVLRRVGHERATWVLTTPGEIAFELAATYAALPEVTFAHPDFLRIISLPTQPNSEGALWGPDGRRLPTDTPVPKGVKSFRGVEPESITLPAGQHLKPTPDSPLVNNASLKKEDFEGSFPNAWDLDGSPTWDDEKYKPYSGKESGYAVGSSVAPPGPYPNNTESWMTFGPFSLANAQDARVNLQAWVETESSFDGFSILASIDGFNFAGLRWSGGWADASGEEGWMNIGFDLKRVYSLGDLTGESQVWITFRFDSDFSITFEGAYIDDIVIEKITSGYEELSSDDFDHLQWSLENNKQLWGDSDADIDVEKGWKDTVGDPSVTIAILDEGVDLDHPDLEANLVPGYDATGLGSQGGHSGNDAHGTNCAGIAAAVTENGIGVAGIAHGASLMPVRIAYSSGSFWITTDSWIADAFDWAWENGADILSNSWGGGTPSSVITNAIERAKDDGRDGKGSVVVFSAGNDDDDVNYPAELNDVLAVAALSPCDERKDQTSCDGEYWWGSSHGPKLDLSAPGVHMYSTDIAGSSGYDSGDYFYNFNGTSSAAPVVAGVAALVLSRDSTLTAREVEDILEDTADDLGKTGRDNETGHGRVNAHQAVIAATPPAALTINLLGDGTGKVTTSPAGIDCNPTCQTDFPNGTAVTLTAKPDPGYTFTGWSGGPDCTDGKLSMNKDKICSATFEVCTAPAEIHVENVTISDSQTYEACDSVYFGPNVTITSSGIASLVAGQAVEIQEQVEVENGGTLEIHAP